MKRLAALAATALLASCRGGGTEEAEQAVRTYLARLADAYRTSDASLMDPLVSERQALTLTGLVGVKRDQGVVLDATLLEIEFERTARQGDGWVVETKERWHYRDRRIGSGEQVGEDSTDSYAMRYRFSRRGGRLVLEELEFAAEPVVGRKVAPAALDPRQAHGLPPREAEATRGAPPGRAADPPAPPEETRR